MNILRKILFTFLGIILVIVIGYALYFAYIYSFFYVASSAFDVESKIVKIVAEENDPTICSKIKIPPFPFSNEAIISEEDLILICYFESASELEDEKICDEIIKVSPKSNSYRNSCIERIPNMIERKKILENSLEPN